MRLVRPLIAGLLGLTIATVFAVVCAVPASAATTTTLTVTPSHALATAPFTVVYQEPARLLLGPCSADSAVVTSMPSGMSIARSSAT